MKLWHLLIAVTVAGVVLGMLPPRIGILALIIIEALLLVALVWLFGADILKKLRNK